MFHMQLQHQEIAHRNGAIETLVFTQKSGHGGIISRYSLTKNTIIHALALHLLIKKYYFVFLYEDLRAQLTPTSVGCISLKEYQQDHTDARNQYY